MLRIDGTRGEGGGQVLRSALTLSLVTGTPFRIDGIRAGRRKPGLKRQHLTAVRAAATVGGATLEGAEIGSLRLTFSPTAGPQAGEYHFAVGTAGSALLVAQTVLPALALAGAPSRLVVEGGTHEQAAPPYDFVARTYLPLLERMGAPSEARLVRHGFYPAGGGRVEISIRPEGALRPLELLERGPVRRWDVRAIVSRLPERIATQQIRLLRERLVFPDDAGTAEVVDSPGPGNVILVALESAPLTEVFCAFGRRDIRSPALVRELAQQVLRYLGIDVPVGRHLADQLVLLLALAGGGRFRTLPLTRHTETNITVIRDFLDVAIETEAVARGVVEVRVGDSGAAGE